MQLKSFTDAEFAGLYTSEDKEDHLSVKSRTVILSNVGEVPILWSSELQLEITLSTLEAEYIALYKGRRELVAAKGSLKKISQIMKFNLDIESKSGICIEKRWYAKYC